MIISALIYGLVICLLLQIDVEKRKAVAVMIAGVLSVDLAYQFGVIGGHWYYLYAIAVSMVVALYLTYFKCRRLVSGLHNACAAMVVVNATDWMLYYLGVFSAGLAYEAVFAAIYLYVWYVMLGKDGANVVTRIKQLRSDSRDDDHRASVTQHSNRHNKV